MGIINVKISGDMMIIKNRHLRISSCLVILILGMSLVPNVSAGGPPSIPNVFEGNLLADGANAPVGTEISAYMDSKLVGSNTIKEIGKYELTVSGNEKDNGKKITFKLGLAESEPVDVTYKHGALPTNVDLTFRGDFVPPVIEKISSSPVYILSDGKDFSVVQARIGGDLSSIGAVTLDLSPMGQGIIPLKAEGGGLYTCTISSTNAGEFKLILTAKDSFGNEAKNEIFLAVLKEGELATRYGGSDRVFSAEEVKTLVNNKDISSGIKYAVLASYFGDGWDRL